MPLYASGRNITSPSSSHTQVLLARFGQGNNKTSQNISPRIKDLFKRAPERPGRRRYLQVLTERTIGSALHHYSLHALSLRKSSLLKKRNAEARWKFPAQYLEKPVERTWCGEMRQNGTLGGWTTQHDSGSNIYYKEDLNLVPEKQT